MMNTPTTMPPTLPVAMSLGDSRVAVIDQPLPPMNAYMSPASEWVTNGQVLGASIVGRWRDASGPYYFNGGVPNYDVEGGFVDNNSDPMVISRRRSPLVYFYIQAAVGTAVCYLGLRNSAGYSMEEAVGVLAPNNEYYFQFPHRLAQDVDRIYIRFDPGDVGDTAQFSDFSVSA